MQPFKNISFKNITLALFVAAFALSLTSCMKDEDAPDPVSVAYVSFFHATPDASELDILVENNRITSQPFKYTNYSGFLNFYTGNRQLRFNPYNAANALLDTTFNFQNSKAYSLFLINEANKLKTLVVEDNVDLPPTGKSLIRLIHLSPDAPEVDLHIDNSSSLLFSEHSFKEASAFKEVNPGTRSLQLKNAGGADMLINLPEVDIQPNKRYTVVIRGFVTPPAGNTNGLSLQLINN
ncbi:DUF4397 domain-containing protein [soil metagenome]